MTYRVVHQDGTMTRLTGSAADVIRTLGETDPARTFVVRNDGATIQVWGSARHFRTQPPLIIATRE